MSRNTGNRSSSQNNGANSLFAGILIGMLVGVCMAAGVAWYLKKSPSPYSQKEQVAEDVKPTPTKQSATAASDADSGKPRFEFYKVLTDKPNAAALTPTKPAEKPKSANKPASQYEPQLLQAGSFSSSEDAEKLKAKLALLGLEAKIQTAAIPDKGVWYRVRLGPYKSAEELNHAQGFLKQNGVDSAPMRAQ